MPKQSASKKPSSKKSAPRTSMTDEHKAALAAGRADGRAVRDYLEALEASKPRLGRRRSAASIEARLSELEELIPEAAPLQRLGLIQERRDLRAELDSTEAEVDLTAVEAAFVERARSYSQRKGISYASWREAGVPATVLRAAGITRSGT